VGPHKLPYGVSHSGLVQTHGIHYKRRYDRVPEGNNLINPGQHGSMPAGPILVMLAYFSDLLELSYHCSTPGRTVDVVFLDFTSVPMGTDEKVDSAWHKRKEWRGSGHTGSTCSRSRRRAKKVDKRM
jgi:hypothetical protein